jgi:thymidylate synthase
MEITGYTANETWLSLIEQIKWSGKIVSPRGITCLEVINMRTVTYMHSPIVTSVARNLGYRFLFAEAAWILSGDYRVKTIQSYSKTIANFSDDTVTFFGAYGPKIREQLPYVCNKLVEDNDTRQAVLTIWRENPPQTKDVPCTIAVQFLIRDNKLNCIVTMRSSDAWLGWPYDTFNFSMLSSMVAVKLNYEVGLKLDLGCLYMNLGSSHLYLRNIDEVEKCLESKEDVIGTFPILCPCIEWETTSQLIKDLWGTAEQRPNDLHSQWSRVFADGAYNK